MLRHCLYELRWLIRLTPCSMPDKTYTTDTSKMMDGALSTPIKDRKCEGHVMIHTYQLILDRIRFFWCFRHFPPHWPNWTKWYSMYRVASPTFLTSMRIFLTAMSFKGFSLKTSWKGLLVLNKASKKSEIGWRSSTTEKPHLPIARRVFFWRHFEPAWLTPSYGIFTTVWQTDGWSYST